VALLDLQTALAKLWLNPELTQRFFAGQAEVGNLVRQEVSQGGMELYGQLISIGRRELLASIYPYIKNLLGKKFDDLVQDFLLGQKVSHYNFNQAAQGLSQFLELHRGLYCKRFPFLAELALYEWLELEVLESDHYHHHHLAPTLPINFAQALSAQEFSLMSPVLNPNLHLCAFEYPISQIVLGLDRKEKLPRRFKKQASYLAIYRDLDELNARFLDLSALTYKLLEKLKEKPQTTFGELIQLAFSLAGDNFDIVEDFLTLIEELQEKQLILGAAPSPC
jgi:hypothetical protein